MNDDLNIDDDILETTVVKTDEDRARLAVGNVLREESVDITTKFMSYVKNRLALTETAYKNIMTIQQDLLDPDVYETMTNQEKIKLLKVLTDQMHILEVPVEEQKITINQLQTQINNVISTDKSLVSLPRESRTKLKEFMLELVKGTFADDKSEPK